MFELLWPYDVLCVSDHGHCSEKATSVTNNKPVHSLHLKYSTANSSMHLK